MEGLIPYVVHAFKKHVHHQNSYRRRSFSDHSHNHSSRRSYHRLLSGESSFHNDSSLHRRAHSDFIVDPSGSELQEVFVRSHSFKKSGGNGETAQAGKKAY